MIRLPNVLTLLIYLASIQILFSQNAVILHVPKALEVDAGNDTTIALGESVILGGNPSAQFGLPPYQYLWTPGGFPTSNPVVSPAVTTEYLVVVTDANGCDVSQTVVVTVSTIGIDEIPEGEEITISPNPSTGLVQVNFHNLSGNAKIKVSDLNGKLVLQKSVTLNDGSLHSINIGETVTGQYIISIIGESFSITRSILKK